MTTSPDPQDANQAEPPPAADQASRPKPKPKAKVSRTRNVIGVVVLVTLLIVGGLEVAAVRQFNDAVESLERAMESEEAALLSEEQVESLLGKEGDGTDEPSGGSEVKKIYNWHGALRSHTLAAYYRRGDISGLVRYEIE